MIKKVKITFDRFKLIRAVILQAEKCTACYSGLPIRQLKDAVIQLNRYEALAVADQWSTGQTRLKVETLRKKVDLPVCDWCHGDHTEDDCKGSE